jgi:hypothetical protein
MNITLKSRELRSWWLIIMGCMANLVYGQSSVAKFDRTAYYAVIGGTDLEAMESQIALLDKSGLKNKDAFTGALMMKRAGLLHGASQKLKAFKAGRVKLEAAIARESDNAEFRFLRLMIQENAPGILGYNDELEKDKDFIIAHFNSIPEPARQVIRDYSRQSKILSQSDF